MAFPKGTSYIIDTQSDSPYEHINWKDEKGTYAIVEFVPMGHTIPQMVTSLSDILRYSDMDMDIPRQLAPGSNFIVENWYENARIGQWTLFGENEYTSMPFTSYTPEKIELDVSRNALTALNSIGNEHEIISKVALFLSNPVQNEPITPQDVTLLETAQELFPRSGLHIYSIPVFENSNGQLAFHYKIFPKGKV